MKKKFTFFTMDLINYINGISATYSYDDMRKQEAKIMLSVCGILTVAVNGVFILLYIFWDFPLRGVIYNLVLMASCYVALIFLKNADISEFIKLHILGAMFVTEYLIIFFMLYKYLTLIYWFTFLLIIIPMSMLRNRIVFNYMAILTIFTVFLSWTLYRDYTIDNNIGYMISTFIIFILIILMVYLMKYIFNKIIDGKLEHIDVIYRQREEIIISERKLKEKNNELMKVAFYDDLTGLPNRREVFEKIKDYIKKNKRFTVLGINIDKFKDINDSLGHSVGDKMLIETAKKLREKLDDENGLARSSGDEFIVLIDDEFPIYNMEEYARELINPEDFLFTADNYEVSISLSCGIASFPKDADNMNELLLAVDSAIYNAKNIGKNTISFYDTSMKEDIVNRIKMEKLLLKALENDELFLVYQPIVIAESGEIEAVETLIRWESPELGFVSPVDFIPLAEKIGIIKEIGYWIMRQVISTAKRIKAETDVNIRFSINVSVVQLEGGNFVDDMIDLLEGENIGPEDIVFELTESVFIEDQDVINKAIAAMRENGFEIAIDDFGTGYSSFSYLTRLPVDILKIDKSFIDLIGESGDNDVVIVGMISIAHILGMKVTAEGVEELGQLEFLKETKTDFIQGYYFSKPQKEDDLIEWIKNNKK